MNISTSRCTAIISVVLMLWPVTCGTFAPTVHASLQPVVLAQPEAQASHYVAVAYLDQAISFQETLLPSTQIGAWVYRDVEPWTLIVVTLVLIGMRLLRVRQKRLPAIG